MFVCVLCVFVCGGEGKRFCWIFVFVGVMEREEKEEREERGERGGGWIGLIVEFLFIGPYFNIFLIYWSKRQLF